MHLLPTAAIFRDGHRHLQIGRMLDIDLISEPPPPPPPPPRCMCPKRGNLCGQRGRKRFISIWGLRMSHICRKSSFCPPLAILFACWQCVDQCGLLLPSTTYRKIMTILKSSIPSHGIDASKNQFHSRNDFSQGIDSAKFRLCSVANTSHKCT